MTIPPIGPSVGSPLPQDERPKTNGNQVNAEPVRQADAPARTPEPRTERVDISQEAQLIRRRQAEITHLQIAERTAGTMHDEAQEITDLTARHATARRERNEAQAAEVRNRTENQTRQMEERAKEARYGNENVLDGREMTFNIENRDEVVKTIDSTREVREFVDRVRKAVAQNRDITGDEFVRKTQEVASRAAEVRARLEKEVRDTVAGVIKESSGTRPADAEAAERLIREARQSGSANQGQPARGVDQISDRAVNLLQ